MNSVLYNYEYMYRRYRNLWTYERVEKLEFPEFAEDTAKTDFRIFDVRTVSPPEILLPP